MATTMTQNPARQEEEARDLALQQLAVLGGKLTKADDVLFKGTKFVIPAHLDLEQAIDFLEQRRDAEETSNRFSRTFLYRPFDGALATAKAVREACGFTVGKTLRSFFGSNPPELIDIPTGVHTREQAPWGAMYLPGLKGVTVYLGSTRHAGLGEVFELTIDSPLKYRHHVEGLFILVQRYLETESIYKGKAIDSEGNFIDTSGVHPELLVYAAGVQRRLEGDLWSFMRFEAQLAEHGQSGKYAVLLEGPYGSGKTEAAGVTAQIAEAHGWTFITAKPGKEQLQHALELARMHEPAIVFAEDVDNDANPHTKSGLRISQMLDQMDGFHVKGQKLIVVFTTNHADRIHKGMLRPGRIGAVIHIGAMDRPGVEILARRVIGESLDDNVDFDAVFASMDGYMPAFVREAFNRAVRYTIAGNNGHMGPVGTTQLCDAADGLRDQLALMEGAPTDPVEQGLTASFERIVARGVNDAKVIDNDGEEMFVISANGT